MSSNSGNSVTVISNVFHQGKEGNKFSSKGLTGTIVDIWGKCEVDPHCCFAESSFDAPINVKLSGNPSRKNLTGQMQWAAQFSSEELEIL